MEAHEEWLDPEEIVHREFNSFRGRLLSVIESMNLPRLQEEAVKTLIKQVSYQQQKTVAELAQTLNTDNARFRYARNRLEKHDG